MISAIWRGGRGQISWKFGQTVVKKANRRGGVKNRLKFADVLNGWSLEVILIFFSAIQIVTWFKKETFKKKQSITPPRTHRISGLKSQVLKSTFLA